MRPIRLALLCDYLEEAWPSMDMVAEMIGEHLRRHHASAVEVTRICPPFRGRASRLPVVRQRGVSRKADLLLNRLVDYPLHVRGLARSRRFDLFHVVDHSYAQLVHSLPLERTIVTCHDLDTFRCLLSPALEPRPAWFRAMTRHSLAGLKKAAAVVCDSEATRGAILGHALVPERRLRTNHLGINPECAADADLEADARATELLGARDQDAPPDLLHVGSNSARKRIDVLLATFAGVRRALPGARLIKVGGAFTEAQTRLARELGVLDSVVVLPRSSTRDPRDRATLAGVYRRAALVLQPSDAEGFGLPVAEAMACGAPLLISDLPVLREIAGDAATYAPVGNVAAWTAAALHSLDERRTRAEPWRRRREIGLARAHSFRWEAHVARLVATYEETLAGGDRSGSRRGAADPGRSWSTGSALVP